MYSAIITAWKEERTVGKAARCFVDAFKFAEIPKEEYEILVSAPDRATQKAAEAAGERVKIIPDDNEGKLAALNRVFALARGKIWFLSDGDVYIDKTAVARILPHFRDKRVALVTGHPKPTNARDNMLGYWARLLTEVGAHAERSYKAGRGEFMEASGYLYALRAPRPRIILPRDGLADDALMSHIVWGHDKKISYEPRACVYVKFPDNLRDWFKQKRRSAGGHNQIRKYYEQGLLDKRKRPRHTRGFWREVSYFFKPFGFARNWREFGWTLALYPARIWLWTLIFWDINLNRRKKVKNGLWERIESTK